MASTQPTDILQIDTETPLHQLRERRHQQGRDLKVVITQRNSETGGGKTTLATCLCLLWDDDWNAEERSTLDPQEFITTYPKLPKHSCLLLDEAEELDARRSMKQQNIDFAKNWMMMRVRQVDSILTLPTSSALDKRLLELADIRINVTERGVGRVYRVIVDDHDTSNIREKLMHRIEWPDISHHPEFKELAETKEERINSRISAHESDEPMEPDEAVKQARDKWIRKAADVEGLTTSEIGRIFGISQSRASQIKNSAD